MPRQSAKKPAGYPLETSGSKLARKARKLANHLSEKEKEEGFEKAMGTIYEQRVDAWKAAGAGH